MWVGLRLGPASVKYASKEGLRYWRRRLRNQGDHANNAGALQRGTGLYTTALPAWSTTPLRGGLALRPSPPPRPPRQTTPPHQGTRETSPPAARILHTNPGRPGSPSILGSPGSSTNLINPPTPACNHPVTAAQRATISALSIRSAMRPCTAPPHQPHGDHARRHWGVGRPPWHPSAAHGRNR